MSQYLVNVLGVVFFPRFSLTASVGMARRTPRCPQCPHSYVAPSKYRRIELPLILLFRRPYRCLTCDGRFMGRIYKLPSFVKSAPSRLRNLIPSAIRIFFSSIF